MASVSIICVNAGTEASGKVRDLGQHLVNLRVVSAATKMRLKVR